MKRRWLGAAAVAIGVAVWAGGCDSDGAQAPSCSEVCPDGTRRASYSEVSVEGQQAAVDGRVYLVVTARCETLCEPVQPCLYPNIPLIAVDPATEEVHYSCDPLEGYSGLEPDFEVDMSFADGWVEPDIEVLLSSFEVPLGGIGNQSLAVGDVDGDGAPDIVDAWDAAPTPTVGVARSGAGSDVFHAPWTVALEGVPRAMDAGDVDGDGDADVIMVAGNTAAALKMGRLEALGDGTLGPFEPAFDAWGCEQLVLADLDGDGRADLVWIDRSRSKVLTDAPDGLGFMLSGAGGALDGPVVGLDDALCNRLASCGTKRFLVDDLDGDGDLDIVAVGADRSIVVHTNSDGAASFTSAAVGEVPFTGEIVGLAAGDFDGSGARGVLVFPRSRSTAAWLRPDGQGGWEAATVIDHGYPSVGSAPSAGDFDGDGRDDVAFIGFEDAGGAAVESFLALWFSDGVDGPGEIAFLKASATNDGRLAVADFDGDGIDDVAAPGVDALIVVLGGAR